MRTKWRAIGSSLFAILVIFLAVPHVSAHVLVPDSTGTIGAVLHVTPGDDPVAGQNTGIYFEVETNEDLKDAVINLTIRSDTGGIEETVPVHATGNALAAVFNFPIRGLYYLDLSITPKDASQKPVRFHTSVRITKGTTGVNSAPAVPAWVTAGLLLSVWCLLLLCITAYRWRTRIAKHSR